jgi:hypothetical protein
MKTTFVALWVGLAGIVASQSAAAEPQGAEDSEAAKAAGTRFQLAVEMYHEGSYEGALAEFKKAYQLSPSYRVLYNIAQAQYALHDFVGAYKSLIQYRTEGKDEISADRIGQVTEMSAKLRERIAHLEISSNVTGADIRVDDVSVGTSPLPGPVLVNVGTRKVSAVKAGFPAAVRSVVVAGKETAKVDLHVDQVVSGAPLVPAKVSPFAGGAAASLSTKAQTPVRPSRLPLIVSLSTTAALAIGTGVVGYLALGAQRDLKNQMNTYPNTSEQIEDARTRSKQYGYAADALGAATVIAGGVSLYFLLSRLGDAEKPARGKKVEAVVLAPTLGGMVLQGNF